MTSNAEAAVTAEEQAQGVPWDEDVFMSDEVREAAVLAYSTDNKMSDRRFKEQQLRRIAFRAGAAWYAKEHGRMTPEEQAPVRCEYIASSQSTFWPRCQLAKGHDGLHCYEYPSVPAPEETVETTEERLTRVEVVDETGRAYVRWNSDVRYELQDNGRTLKVFVKPEWIGPEPAGGAEERLEHDDNAEYCAACGEFPPAPSTGTSGLTEAQLSIRDLWDDYNDALGSYRMQILQRDDDWSVDTAPVQDALDALVAATAAEASAPLVEEVDALNRVIAMRSEVHLLAEARAEDAEARIAELERTLAGWQNAVTVHNRRAEDAERKLEEMREALKAIMDSPGSTTAIQLKLMAERALTPPASTAQGDEG